jgi:hypothetical protein
VFSPYIKFGGFIIHRDGGSIGGDIITYFKDVQVIYDKAVLDPEASDINDESEWNIIKEREADRQKREFTGFGKDQVWRYLETEKKAPETYFSDTEARNAAAATAPAAAGQQ